MSDMSEIGKQLVFDFLQHIVGFRRFLRQRFLKKPVECARLNVRKDGALFDVFEVIGEEINYPMAQVTKLI